MGTVAFYDEKFQWGSSKANHTYTHRWFDLKKYHQYNFCYISNDKQFQKGPQPDEWTEVRWWIQDNLEGEVMVSYDNSSSSLRLVYLYFQHDTDLTAFKLVWPGI